MEILHDKNYEEIVELVARCGEKSFRAKQIFSNISKGIKISEMTDISKAFREKLLNRFIDEPCEIIEALVSKDGTEKYLYKLHDGNVIEGVLMKYKYGYTLCVSTQVGCRMGCAFCASTIDGLQRNLSRGEILCEVLAANRRKSVDGERAITNIVLMGSGEPLDNYDEVVGFLRLVSSPDGINISPRNISLSTCGLVPKMYDLANEGLPVNLTVSLHSPFDEKRKKIMPVAKSYSIAEILSACDNYFEKTGRRYYFEYSLIAGENDTDECAEELFKLLKGKPCHVNLIRLNSVKERDLKGSSRDSASAFLKKLESFGLSAT
ncbi:MAG: 23S rRNA (adenine(2503)-C(2))-methyltransferase RlmN, partial [Clostridia bacterium]|nr:23S rRNA (adenine(2503)-C(2))-methyltransferase RlmN [Clostridia bacterium]